MLGDQDRLWHRSTQVSQNLEQRLRAAGRAADSDQIGALDWLPAQRYGPRGARRRLPGRRHQPCGRRPGRAAPTAAAGLGERLDLRRQLVLERIGGMDLAGGAWLGHVVRRTQGQGAQADLRVLAGQRRGHEDLNSRLLLQNQWQRRHAVHDRHLDIEHDDLDVGPAQLVERHLPVGNRGDHGYLRIGLQEPCEQPPDHR